MILFDVWNREMMVLGVWMCIEVVVTTLVSLQDHRSLKTHSIKCADLRKTNLRSSLFTLLIFLREILLPFPRCSGLFCVHRDANYTSPDFEFNFATVPYLTINLSN